MANRVTDSWGCTGNRPRWKDRPSQGIWPKGAGAGTRSHDHRHDLPCGFAHRSDCHYAGLDEAIRGGKLRLNDPVTLTCPNFRAARGEVTIRDLMTHFSGLRPDLTLEPAWSGYETGIHKALIDKPTGPPGVQFVYSDINFELLGETVHRLSGEDAGRIREGRSDRWACTNRCSVRPLRCVHASRPPRSIPRRARRFEGARPNLTLYGRGSRARRSVHNGDRSFSLCGNDGRRWWLIFHR